MRNKTRQPENVLRAPRLDLAVGLLALACSPPMTAKLPACTRLPPNSYILRTWHPFQPMMYRYVESSLNGTDGSMNAQRGRLEASTLEARYVYLCTYIGTWQAGCKSQSYYSRCLLGYLDSPGVCWPT